MVKRLFFSFLVLTLGRAFLNAQTLDESIRQAAAEMSERLTGGSTVAVINFQSPKNELTEYVIDELNGAIVRIGRIRAVERRRLEAIRTELQFNISGEVSDESAQSIGRILGAQSIIMGSLQTIGSSHRIRFQAVSTEDAVIQHVFSGNIYDDNILVSLLVGSNTPALRPVDTENREASSFSAKISLGGVLGLINRQGRPKNADYTDSQIRLNIGATFNFRLLFPLENKLQLGLGGDLTVLYSLKIIETRHENTYIIEVPVSGTLAPYAILGFSNAYLHAGYDFVYGALYVCPGYKMNEHLFIGLPMSLFGSSERFSIYSLIQSSLNSNHVSNAFQIGLSVQYVF